MSQKYITLRQGSELKLCPLHLGNIFKDFTIYKMKNKTGLNGYVHDVSVDCYAVDISDIIDFHEYLMKIMIWSKCWSN